MQSMLQEGEVMLFWLRLPFGIKSGLITGPVLVLLFEGLFYLIPITKPTDTTHILWVAIFLGVSILVGFMDWIAYDRPFNRRVFRH